MSKRLRRGMKRRSRGPVMPQYGDEVFIPSEHPDGHWTNGIVNSGLPGGRDHARGELLVACPGHRFSNLVVVPLTGYLTSWCWPEDVGARPTGAKAARLEDVQG